MPQESIAIYVHWPFCKSKCPYCDFNSHVWKEIDEAKWLEAYLMNLEYYRELLKGREVCSIFFGGGTPSLASTRLISSIINKVSVLARVTPETEITMEANPTSVESRKFSELKEAGVRRLSLGVQSFNSSDLQFLGREHSVNEAKKAIELAAKHFSRYSFDLIYALPGQSLERWKDELLEALQYVSGHLSLYQLTIEKGTQFFKDYRAKAFTMPDDILSAEFYELTQEVMESNNMPAYEISNHAFLGQECIHSMNYWRYGDYLGIGPGAHGKYESAGIKQSTIAYYEPSKWLKSVFEDKHGFQQIQQLNGLEAYNEALIMGLRLTSGLEKDFFANDTETQHKLSGFIQDKLLKEERGKIKATSRGLMLLDSLARELIQG